VAARRACPGCFLQRIYTRSARYIIAEAGDKPRRRNSFDMPVTCQQNFNHPRCPAKLSVPRMCSSEPRSLISLLNAPKETASWLASAAGILAFWRMAIAQTAKRLADPGCKSKHVLSLINEIDERQLLTAIAPPAVT
jgi:hypothetical protein